jgi:hypothetical protein
MDEVHTTQDDRHEAVDEYVRKQIEESDRPELAKKALIRINKIRRKFGAEPLLDLKKGRVGESQNCPLFNSLIDLRDAEVRSVGGRVAIRIPWWKTVPSVEELKAAINGDDVYVQWHPEDRIFYIEAADLTEFVNVFDDASRGFESFEDQNEHKRLVYQLQELYSREGAMVKDPDQVTVPPDPDEF